MQAVNSSLEKTQNAVSSGLRIQKASDNAAYWSIATTMKSDNSAMGAAQDALGLGAATVNTMYEGMSSAIDLVSKFKAELVTATEDSVDKTKVNDELTQIKEQLRTISYSTSFNGEQWFAMTDDNWHGFVDPQTVVGGFVRGADGSVSTQTISVTPSFDDIATMGTGANYELLDDTGGAATGDGGILTSWRYASDLGISTHWVITHTEGAPDGTLGQEMVLTPTTSKDDINDMIQVVDAMQSQMVTAASWYGSAAKRISMQQEFMSSLRDSTSSGIGKLIDANMEQESSRLSALQTQQQLAVQSLSIANSSPKTILSLFQS